MIKKTLNILTSPQLTKLSRESSKKVEQLISENVFNSKTMKELLTDTYCAQKPNTVVVQHSLSGEPVELLLKTSKTPLKNSNEISETYDLIDKYGQLAGRKRLYIRQNQNSKPEIFEDGMVNESGYLNGVGFRLDQIHIERALQLGLDVIKRTALAKAILYHIKMGFLPVETLVRVKNVNDVKNLIFDYLLKAKNVAKSDVIPVIKETDRGFYFDENKTSALTNLSYCKQLIEKIKTKRIHGFDAPHTTLELKAEELERWKEIIKTNPILTSRG